MNIENTGRKYSDILEENSKWYLRNRAYMEKKSGVLVHNEKQDEYYVQIDHEMSKRHYISFIAAVSTDRIQMVKLYHQGNAEARFKIGGVKRIYYYCNQSGYDETFMLLPAESQGFVLELDKYLTEKGSKRTIKFAKSGNALRKLIEAEIDYVDRV